MQERFWPFGHADPTQDDSAEGAVALDEPPTAPQPASEAEPEGLEEEGGPQEPERPHRTLRARFRYYRRTRPFWGAVLMILGGLEIAAIPATAWRILMLSPSVVLAIAVGLVAVILGTVALMSPTQNKLYGLLGVLMAGVSFVTSNLGGFLIGALVTLLGGALTFAWTELPEQEQVPAP